MLYKRREYINNNVFVYCNIFEYISSHRSRYIQTITDVALLCSKGERPSIFRGQTGRRGYLWQRFTFYGILPLRGRDFFAPLRLQSLVNVFSISTRRQVSEKRKQMNFTLVKKRSGFSQKSNLEIKFGLPVDCQWNIEMNAMYKVEVYEFIFTSNKSIHS